MALATWKSGVCPYPEFNLLSSSFFPPYTHFPSVLWILWQEPSKKKKVTIEMCALEQKLHFIACWLKLWLPENVVVSWDAWDPLVAIPDNWVGNARPSLPPCFGSGRGSVVTWGWSSVSYTSNVAGGLCPFLMVVLVWKNLPISYQECGKKGYRCPSAGKPWLSILPPVVGNTALH